MPTPTRKHAAILSACALTAWLHHTTHDLRTSRAHMRHLHYTYTHRTRTPQTHA